MTKKFDNNKTLERLDEAGFKCVDLNNGELQFFERKTLRYRCIDGVWFHVASNGKLTHTWSEIVYDTNNVICMYDVL